MAKYFNYFPKTFYYVNDLPGGDLQNITNLTARYKFNSDLTENLSAYYTYTVQEGERPEMIAHKFYGSSERHWIILLFNNITNPLLDWPMDYSTLIEFVENKYVENADVNGGETGLEWAQSNIKEYYYREKTIIESTGEFYENVYNLDLDNYTNFINSIESHTLSDGELVTIQQTKHTKTYYDYEIENNESKRDIKILKTEFVLDVESEFRDNI